MSSKIAGIVLLGGLILAVILSFVILMWNWGKFSDAQHSITPAPTTKSSSQLYRVEQTGPTLVDARLVNGSLATFTFATSFEQACA